MRRSASGGETVTRYHWPDSGASAPRSDPNPAPLEQHEHEDEDDTTMTTEPRRWR